MVNARQPLLWCLFLVSTVLVHFLVSSSLQGGEAGGCGGDHSLDGLCTVEGGASNEALATAPRVKTPRQPLSWPHKSVDKVMNGSWGKRAFADRVIKETEWPTLVEGTVASTWPAISKWTPQYFMENFGTRVVPTYINERHTFEYYIPENPMAQLPQGKWHHPFANESMTVASLWEAILDDTDPNYYCFSGSPDLLGPTLKVDIPYLNELGPLSVSGFAPNLWFASAGTTTQLHYDSYHNFFVQVYGKKRFTLVHPRQWPLLNLYPRLHPMVSQSQVDLENVNTAKFNRVDDVQVIEVTLEPGQVLYLPPYWGHHVEALTNAISVNAWSDSSEFKAWNRILTTAMPFEEDWDKSTTYIATKVFASVFANGVMPPQDAKNFLEELWIQRYAPLFEESLFDWKAGVEKYCPQDKVEAVQGTLMSKFQPTLKSLKDHFRKLMTPYSKQIYAGNFIEDLVLSTLGKETDVFEVAVYMRSCFLPEVLPVLPTPSTLRRS